MKKIKYFLAPIFLFLIGIRTEAQAKPNGDSAAKSLLLSVVYVNSNNQLQYLKATAKTKISGKFTLVPGIVVTGYIKEDSPQNLLGKSTTNEKGEAIIYLTPAVKDIWMSSPQQHFIVASDAGMGFSAATGEVDMTKAKLQIDTTEGRSVVVRLLQLVKGNWVAAKEVDVKLAIRRMGGDLNVADAPTYTTDSAGSFSVDFKRDDLPGDEHGNISLVASVDDNDTYGTLSAEKIVPWGVYQPWVSNFDKRSLYARRGRAPIWLDFMAYSIIAVVWGSLIFLLYQLVRIRKLGRDGSELRTR
jgi:hypothetical protein